MQSDGGQHQYQHIKQAMKDEIKEHREKTWSDMIENLSIADN